LLWVFAIRLHGVTGQWGNFHLGKALLCKSSKNDLRNKAKNWRKSRNLLLCCFLHRAIGSIHFGLCWLGGTEERREIRYIFAPEIYEINALID
jgi:hypothetical protein